MFGVLVESFTLLFLALNCFTMIMIVPLIITVIIIEIIIEE